MTWASLDRPGHVWETRVTTKPGITVKPDVARASLCVEKSTPVQSARDREHEGNLIKSTG